MYYVLPVLHDSYLYVCFVSVSVYMLTEIPNRLSNLFYTNSFIFVDANVDIEIAKHSDLVLCNSFINYKMLPDITPERKCSNDYRFSLALFIFPIMFARVFLRSKHKRVKTIFGCIIFLLPKNDIIKSATEIFTYESIDT